MQIRTIMTTKKLMLLLAILPVIAMVSCKSAPESDVAKTGEALNVSEIANSVIYPINLNESKMEWIGTKLSTHHHGEVAIKSGELQINDGLLAGGKFSINMTTLVAHDNGSENKNEKLTGHLMSPDFFDVANYPEATFEITGIKPFNGTVTVPEKGAEEISEYKVLNPNYLISGNLKIKDITKNIEFPARVDVTSKDISATAKFNIDRKLWGIVYPGIPDDMIQDMIWFGISLKSEITAQTAMN